MPPRPSSSRISKPSTVSSAIVADGRASWRHVWPGRRVQMIAQILSRDLVIDPSEFFRQSRGKSWEPYKVLVQIGPVAPDPSDPVLGSNQLRRDSVGTTAARDSEPGSLPAEVEAGANP